VGLELVFRGTRLAVVEMQSSFGRRQMIIGFDRRRQAIDTLGLAVKLEDVRKLSVRMLLRLSRSGLGRVLQGVVGLEAGAGRGGLHCSGNRKHWLGLQWFQVVQVRLKFRKGHPRNRKHPGLSGTQHSNAVSTL